MGTRVTSDDQPHRVAGLPPLVGAALRAVLWIGLGIGVAGPDAISSLEAQTGPRLVTVISDLHIGTGRDESGAWHPTEDFRWDDEFALFLEHLTALGENANDLVLNGDTFELSEAVRGVDGCQYDVPALGCTQDEALARLDVVLSAHARAIDALANFARVGSNRIFVIPGDHDAALMFPAVAARAGQALGGVEAGVQIQMEGFWASSDGKVYAEHGHQIGDRPNRFSQWPPAVDGSTDGSDTRHLERPWGIQTVGEFFTQHEPRYPTIDNIAERGAGLSYGLAASGTARLDADASRLLRYVLFRMPWSQFRVDLDAGDVQPPRWDLSAVRTLGPTFLLDSLPDDHRFKPLAIAAHEDEQLDIMMDELTDDELTAICDYRAATRRSRRRFERILTQFDPQGPVVAECPRDPSTRGGAFDYFWRSRDATFLRRLEHASTQLPTGTGPIAVFVHGHTHLVDWAQRVLELTSQGETVIVDGFSPIRGALSPVVINGGAWQRTVTPVQLDRLRAQHDLTDDTLLRTLQPEDLAPCYSFVQVDPYTAAPDLPVIRYWRDGDDGWDIARSCGRQPSLGN
jgi:hypothetical protein